METDMQGLERMGGISVELICITEATDEPVDQRCQWQLCDIFVRGRPVVQRAYTK